MIAKLDRFAATIPGVSVSVKFIMLSIVMLLVIGCGSSGGDGSSDSPLDLNSRIDIHTNPTDGTLLKATTDDNTTIIYHGARDADGFPVEVNTVTVSTADSDGDFIVTLNENSMPETVLTPSGAIYNLSHTTNSSFQLNAISASGAIDISVPVTLQSNDASVTSENSAEKITTSSNKNLHLTASSYLEFFNQHITLTQCGHPVKNARITMYMSPSEGSKGYIGVYTGDGTYSFSIPQIDVPPPPYEQLCKQTAKSINSVCWDWSAAKISFDLPEKNYCDELEDAISYWFNGADEVEKNSIADTCDTMSKSVVGTLCDWSQRNDIEQLCNSGQKVHLQSQGQGSYQFSLEIKMPKLPVFTTDSIYFEPEVESFWELEAPTQIQCGKIWTEPANPQPDESYLAKASLVCVDPNGIEVTITVEGQDDSYTESYMETMTADGEIELLVPGSSDSSETMSDRITISAVEDGTNHIWSKAIIREATPTSITFPLHFSGTGTTVEGERYSDSSEIFCSSTATWEMTLSASGGLSGTYTNTAPSIAWSSMCIDSSHPSWGSYPETFEIYFDGTHENGAFEISGGPMYFYYTSKPFLPYGGVITGRYNAGRLWTDPKFSWTETPAYASYEEILEYEFSLPSTP